MSEPEMPYKNLEDFLKRTDLNVDGSLDDGWGKPLPVKGCEIEATILFSDVASFSARTRDLSPVETLVYVNTFFTWISAEALEGRPGLIDKFIGDEIMVVFSKEFGSEDPFVDAVRAARRMREHDAHDYAPNIGIASGEVVVAWTGTPQLYSATVYGAPVTLASRCAGIKPPEDAGMVSSTIVFPSSEWNERDFNEVLPSTTIFVPEEIRQPGEAETFEKEHGFELQQPRMVEMKNLSDIEVREIYDRSLRIPSTSAEDRAREGVAALKKHGIYSPKF